MHYKQYVQTTENLKKKTGIKLYNTLALPSLLVVKIGPLKQEMQEE